MRLEVVRIRADYGQQTDLRFPAVEREEVSVLAASGGVV